MPDIRKKYLDFLEVETEYWQEEGIITPEQSEQILELYEIKRFNLHKILFIAGGVLIGLGIASFIASQWHLFPKVLRVCIIIGAYLASLAASTKYRHPFLLLASAIFGAGIFLITRMYDYKLTFSEIIGWWADWVILTAIVSRDEWQMYFAQAISLLYLNVINAIDIFALQFMNTAREPVMSFFSPVKAFGLVAVLWVAWAVVRERGALIVNIAVTLLLLASRMSLCFGGTWTMLILALTGAVMSFTRHHDIEIFGLLVLGLQGVLLTWPEFWTGEIFAPYLKYLPVITALFVGVIMIVNIYRGHVITGVVFFALLASRYFFDRIFGYIPKAWGFSITGLIFLIAGAVFFRKHDDGQ